MKRAARLAGEVAAAAVAAAGLAWLLLGTRLFRRVRDFPDPIPGLEWKELVAFALPFVLLLWVFVVRRGETSSLVGVLTAAVLLVGHTYARLDWTVFFTRGLELTARNAVAPAALVVAVAFLFVVPVAYHVARRRGDLARAYADKGADPADVDAARSAALRGGLATLGDATLATALAVGALVVVPSAIRAGVPPTLAIVGAIVAVALLALALVGVPRWVERRALRRARRAAAGQ